MRLQGRIGGDLAAIEPFWISMWSFLITSCNMHYEVHVNAWCILIVKNTGWESMQGISRMPKKERNRHPELIYLSFPNFTSIEFELVTSPHPHARPALPKCYNAFGKSNFNLKVCTTIDVSFTFIALRQCSLPVPTFSRIRIISKYNFKVFRHVIKSVKFLFLQQVPFLCSKLPYPGLIIKMSTNLLHTLKQERG